MRRIFDRHYKRYDAWYDKYRFAFLSEVKAVKKIMPRAGKGLEIGVGTGRFAAALGITAGVDPSRPMLKIAQSRGINVCCGEGEELPYPDKTFD